MIRSGMTISWRSMTSWMTMASGMIPPWMLKWQWCLGWQSLGWQSLRWQWHLGQGHLVHFGFILGDSDQLLPGWRKHFLGSFQIQKCVLTFWCPHSPQDWRRWSQNISRCSPSSRSFHISDSLQVSQCNPLAPVKVYFIFSCKTLLYFLL